MRISTSRFGTVEIEAEDILLLPHGIVGFEHARHWVLLADGENPSLGWLQSAAQPTLAVPVVSPRRFVPDYQVRLTRRDIGPLELEELSQGYVLVIVSRNDEKLTVNLKAPLIINLDRNIGRQVVTRDDQPLQMELGLASRPYRKSA